jgi:hypothetical protein
MIECVELKKHKLGLNHPNIIEHIKLLKDSLKWSRTSSETV